MSAMRKSNLAAALSRVEKAVGKKSHSYIQDGKLDRPIVVSSGSIALDIALGCGGLPAGRFVEIYGGESAGKTTLCLATIARAQKRGSTCAYIDAEHALDPAYAQALGVNLEELISYAPETGEEVFRICEILAESNAVDIIVIDSAAALLPKSEALGLTDDSSAQALLIGNALKKLNPLIARSKTLILFTNQIRVNVSAIDGDNETTPCGHAMKHYMTMRLCLRQSLPDPTKPIPGVEVACKTVKNKLGPQFVETKLFLNMGFVREYELTDLGRKYGVLIKDTETGCLMFGAKAVGRSTGEVRQLFQEHPELADEIEASIRERAGLSGDLKVV
jgi:recombination protein RecA